MRAAVGYRQVWDYLQSGGDREEMVQRALSATGALARRQKNWLRRWENLRAFDLREGDKLRGELRAFL